MRTNKILVKEAEMMARPATSVLAWLKEESEKVDSRFPENSDEELEASLLSRNEPLVDIALAQYALHEETAFTLFWRPDEQTLGPAFNAAIRLAVLSNRPLSKCSISGTPTNLFNDDTAACANWVATAPDGEIVALFQNSEISGSFLRDVLERAKEWEIISDKRLRFIVSCLSTNERMWEKFDERDSDGWAHYSHTAVFNVAWQLAEKVPTTNDWAQALSSLYANLIPEAFSIDNPLKIAERWLPATHDEKAAKNEESDNKIGFLGPYQAVRSGLVCLAIAKGTDGKFFVSKDLAYRCAAYKSMSLTPKQMRQALERDGAIAYRYLLDNESLWKQNVTRETLQTLSWDSTGSDSDLLSVDVFSGRRDYYAKLHPEWFKDDEA